MIVFANPMGGTMFVMSASVSPANSFPSMKFSVEQTCIQETDRQCLGYIYTGLVGTNCTHTTLEKLIWDRMLQ